MNTEELIGNYLPEIDIISVIICSVLFFLISKVLFFANDKKFMLLKKSVLFIEIGSASNIAFYLTASKCPNTTAILFVFRDLYHISFLLSLYSFILYTKEMIDINKRFETFVTFISRSLFIVCLTLDLLSPLTKFGFHISDGKWIDPIISFYNIFYVYAFFLFFMMLTFYSRRMIKKVRFCLGVTGLIVGVIMVYQGIANTNTYTSFTYVLPILVVMILLHSKPFDEKTGALDSASFDSFIKKAFKERIPVDYITLKLNVNMLKVFPKELGKVLNSFWHDSFKNVLFFQLSSDVFVMAIPNDKKNGDIKEKVNDLINTSFYKYYGQYKVPYKLVGLFGFDFVENLTDILGITKYLLVTMEENSVLLIDDKRINDFRIMKQVKENLTDIENKKNFDDPRVLTYYQPIRNMKNGVFDTAEALMRLQLDGIGLVQPAMFIVMAEEYGYINTLTKIMLNKVCKQLKQMEGLGIKRISVNVSALDMKMEGFCEEIINIIKSNGVDCSKIGIELTETQSDSDFKIIKEKIKILRDAGLTLYLDDVGTGYSNLDRIVQYDVDVVKFDRFFLLEAEKSMKIVKMMSHLSQAFQDLEYKLLFEGVETESHEALVMNCSADYIQGFKYSKPLPFENYVDFLKNELNQSPAIVRPEENENFHASEKRDFTYEEIKDQYSVLIAMSKLFYSMHIIDLVNNTVKPYNPTDDLKVKNVVNSTMGADQMMKQIMRMCTVDEYVDDVLKFSDLTTIADRMINKKILSSDKYIGKSIGWYVASFYTIEADSSGRPTKVVYTTRGVDGNK